LTDQLHDVVRREGWAGDPFVLHHGSLSKDLREEVEQTLKSGQPVTAVCTSTLEMGIDIGSVKTVCQVDPTWSVMSLIQRVGRSGRKEDESQILRLYTIDDELVAESKPSKRLYPKLVRGIALIELLTQKWVETNPTERMHYSTCIHQILSILRQTGGCHTMSLHNLLCVKGAFRRITKKDFIKLLRYLKDRELIEQMKTGEIILAPAGEKIVEARDFYAAFLVEIEYCVEQHGEQIGLLPLSKLPNVKKLILLAGRRWQVEAIYHDQRQVVVIPELPAQSYTLCVVHNFLLIALIGDRSLDYVILHQPIVDPHINNRNT
jgi:ATP-dependent Lhr-like helicase